MDTQDDVSELGETLTTGVDPTPSELRLAAAIRARVFPGVAPDTLDVEAPRARFGPSRLGRYTVLRELGRGGMGVVYACYDEQLDRKVAVKLLRASLPERSARARLEREAQALARLSHPNVVQIYELGEHHGELFVAMEFVSGQTMREWLYPQGRGTSVARDWREVVGLLREVGRGLAAAHAVDLVHRDFKPDNVMVGDDGRARVLDFGLVRHVPSSDQLVTSDGGASGEMTLGDEASDIGMEATGLLALTRVGTLMGTPVYMAPEQFLTAPCDAASDQFSFCVVAFEGLFGCRPFAGKNLEQLSTAVLDGPPAPIPADSPVPRRLQAAILRGLARESGDRWPDMDALLGELERALGAKRKPWQATAGLGLVAALVAGVVFAQSRGAAPLCEPDASALAEAWGDEGRAALRRSSASWGLSDESRVRVDRALTEWGERWLDSQRHNCVDTRVRGVQSEELLDRRGACLERQRREFAAITTQLTRVDNTGADAFGLLERLPDLAVCGDPRLATTPHPLPTATARREAILDAYARLSEARALGLTRHLAEAEEILGELEAAELNYLPLDIQIRSLAAERWFWRGQIDRAVPMLEAVIREAEIADLEELSANSRTLLADRIVGEWGPALAQEAALDEAEIALARLGRAEDRRHALLAQARADWTTDRGEFEAAMELHRANLDAARSRGDLVLAGVALQSLGRVLVELERYDDAERAFVDARTNYVEAYGPDSHSEARIELDLALLTLGRGDFDAASKEFERLRERYEALLAPGSDVFAMVGLAQAKLALFRGELARAAGGFEDVIARGGDDDVHQAEAWQGLGATRFYQGDFVASAAAYRKARARLLRALSPEHPSVGLVYANLGEALAAGGDHESALEAYAEASVSFEVSLPEDHLSRAFLAKILAESYLARGEHEAARAQLERALGIHERNPGEPNERADVEFDLARAIWDSEPARARALTEAAGGRLRGLGLDAEAMAIEVWLDERGTDPASSQ